MVENGDAICYTFQFVEVMRCDDDGAVWTAKRPDQVSETVGPNWVKAVRRFVEDDNARVAEQRLSDAEALAISFRELFHTLAEVFL